MSTARPAPAGRPFDAAPHAVRWARSALAVLRTRYPHQVVRTVRGPGERLDPAADHPVFHGAFDWHSAVHTHWLLVRLLRRYRLGAAGAEVRAVLDAGLTPAAAAAEAAYLREHPGFMLPYGQAWLLMLAAECRAAAATVPGAAAWSAALAPALEACCAAFTRWPEQGALPVRHGTHGNTAFALGLLLDAAATARGTPGDGDAGALEEPAARARAVLLDRFAADRDAPAAWEPSGHDFLSPSLAEADAVRRVLPPAAFADWLHGFLPGLAAGHPRALLTPPSVPDRPDPLTGHLVGLNFARAAAMRSIAAALPPDDPRRPVLTASAAAHWAAGLPRVVTGDFAGDHWLATFALLAAEAGDGPQAVDGASGEEKSTRHVLKGS